MKIKQTALIVIVITVFAVLFSSSVFADTSPLPRETQTNSSVINNVTFNIKVSRFYTDATTALQGGGTLPYFVSIAVINNNDISVLINGLRYKIVFSGSDTYYYQGYSNYSNDLFTTMLPTDANNYVSVGASMDYTYGNGIVVPPHKAMYLCCTLELATTLNQSTMTWPVPTMDHVYFPNDITVTTGNYPYNNDPIDFTPVLNAIYTLDQNQAKDDQLEDVIDLLESLDTTTSDGITLLSDLINAVSYTGSAYTQSNSGYTRNTIPNINVGDTDLIFRGGVYRLPSYYLTDDIELNTSDDTIIHAGTKVYPVRILIHLLNNNIKTYATYPDWTITNILPTGGSVVLDKLESNLFGNCYYSDSNINLTFNHQFGQNSYISLRNNYTVISFNIYATSDATITWPSSSGIGLSYIRITETTGYYPDDVYYIVRDLYLAYESVNGSSAVSDASDSLDTTGTQVHTQEQAYYTANRSAIEATGLQNYQFSQDQSNGIGAVSNDFTALWNAMGSWTGVYIFSLTIGLAMMILRHVPGMVRSHRSKQSDD